MIQSVINFIKKEINPGIVLLFSSVLAMIAANSGLGEMYFKLFEDTTITIDFQLWTLSKPLYYWINDGLMAIFFFLIGLEIKREILLGELSQPKKALLPIIAAVGGMVVPAAIYALFTSGDPIHSKGWAIPMATDIAFVLGILSLMKNRVPLALKVFLTTLAIVDDMGAVLTIAFFYTSQISIDYLLIALAGWILLWILNKSGVRLFWVFLIIGVFLVWYPLLKSGVHATIAGVLVAFTIPVSRKYRVSEYVGKVEEALVDLKNSIGTEKQVILKTKQYHAVEEIKGHCEKVSSPLQNLEHSLHNFTFYFIMPLFAFANTGIRFGDIEPGLLYQNSLVLGIFFGLFFGKMAGIAGFIWFFRKLGIVDFPEGISWKHILGAGFLAGIGFTMSIFITDLAFHGDQLISLSKMTILTASLGAGFVGFLILKKA